MAVAQDDAPTPKRASPYCAASVLLAGCTILEVVADVASRRFTVVLASKVPVAALGRAPPVGGV
jgi:hypothetical protein